jgi:hypothetical protein
VHKAQTLSKTDTTVLNSESFDFTYLAMFSYIGEIMARQSNEVINRFLLFALYFINSQLKSVGNQPCLLRYNVVIEAY